MQLPRTFLAGFLAVLAMAGAKAASLEFSGYVAGETESRFVISDSATKERSGLLTIGQQFGGYRVIGFDRAQETLTVQRGNEVLRLKLRQAGSSLGAYDEMPLPRRLAGPVPGWGHDLYATRADQEKNLKMIQKALGNTPVPYPSAPPRR